jgi:hypothetical protein
VRLGAPVKLSVDSWDRGSCLAGSKQRSVSLV